VAYPFPFLSLPAGHDPTSGAPLVNIWGQLRARANVLSESAPDQVTVQFKPADGSADWTNVGLLPVTNAFGYFRADNFALPSAGQIRMYWAGPQAPGTWTTLPQNVS
jgi:hypothetical protein